MDDVEHLAVLVSQLCDGWTERIEYAVSINSHVEARAKTIRHPALLIELWSATEGPGMPDNIGGGKQKPQSKPPGSLEAADVIIAIRELARSTRSAWSDHRCLPRPVAHELRGLVSLAGQRSPCEVADTSWALKRLVRTARVLLGHDMPTKLLPDYVCDMCGGALRVATDASSDVFCVGTDLAPSCGNAYRQTQWWDLYESQQREQSEYQDQ